MKSFKYILLSVVAVSFMSCLGDAEDDYSPAIGMSTIVCNRTDTLYMRVNSDGSYRMDTVNVGDTINYALSFTGYTKNIVSILCSLNGNSVSHTLLLDDKFRTVLTGQTDEANGQLYFTAGYSGAAIPIRLVAEKSGSTIINYELNTESKYSPATASFSVPVR